MNPTDLGLDYGMAIGLPVADIRTIVAGLIRAALGVVGVFLVVQIIWSGFLLMTHGGNEDKKDKAVGALKDSIVGFIVIMSSASIARFVIDAIANATGTYLY